MRVAHSHPTTQLASPPNDPHRFAEAAKLLLVALRLLEAMLRPGGVRRRVTRALRWIGLADPAPRVRDTLCAPETRSSDHCGVREKEKGGPGPPYRVHSEGFEPGVTLWTRWISNKWAAAALSAVLVAALYAVSWVVCHAFRISVTYSAFWPPTGVVVGSMIAMNWRFRWLFPPFAFLSAWVIRTFYLLRPAGPSAAFAAEMLFQTLGISLFTIFFASLFSKTPGVAVDLSNSWHVLAFALGCCWGFVSALLRMAIIAAYTTFSWPGFGDSYLNVLDVATICLVAPFIISIAYSPPSPRLLCTHPRLSLAYLATLVIVSILPFLFTAIFSTYTLFPFMAGLYITFPLINVWAPKVGVVGISFGFLCSGISAGATAIARWNGFSDAQREKAAFGIRDQMLWIQLFLYILVFSSLTFVSVIRDRDRARASVESTVAQRTHELREALKLVEKERETAREASKEKGVFLGFLAHELRNPLHAITNLSESLVEHTSTPISAALPPDLSQFLGALPPDLQKDDVSSTAQSIRLCARYVLGLVSDVMDVGALQENRMLLHPAPTDVDQLIGDAVNGLRALATSHRCTIDAEVGKLGTAVLDPDRVRQVLVNLGNDCIRYSPADSRVELKVWVQRRCPGLGKAGKAEERIELVEGEERLRITVSDHGPGMTPEQMEELFRPYVLSTASESREYAGSGLGLAIAKRVVELMGGRIWVSSELGNGTRFDVDIPLLRTGKEATTERLKMDGLGSPKMGARSVSRRRSSGGVSAGSIPSISVMGSVTAVPGSPTPTDISTGMGEATLSPNLPVAGPRRILVTDDSSLNRKILVKMITRILGDRSGDADWIIDEAENGEEAVSRVAGLLASEERNYAIVFMDVVMPVLDGYEATRRIKGLLLEPLSSGSRDPVPVIITTANQVTGTPEAEAEWRESGADAAIGKPFGKTDIERVFDAFGVFAGKG